VSPSREIVTFLAPLLIFLFVLILNVTSSYSGQQFSYLAQSFLHGQLNFLKPIGGLGQDPVLYHGKIYWDEGPFPAILLMPFVWFFGLFHLFFYQGYLMWVLEVGVLFLVYKIARLLLFSLEDSLLLAFGFTLGSVYIGVASVSSSWFFAQVVTTFLLLLCFYEYFNRKQTRWWLIGILCGLILLSRLTAAPIVIFFGLECLQKFKLTRKAVSHAAALFISPVIAVFLVGLYNYLRFHNPLNGGFKYQLLYPQSVYSRSLGIISLVHIPTNFYYAFLSGPNFSVRTASSWTLKFPYITDNNDGMSIFFTSPYLLYIFMQKWRLFDARIRNLLIAVAASAFLLFTSFAVGPLQFGYRYSLDFLPELFLVFMLLYRKNYTHLTRGMKFLLIISGLFNFYILATFLW
jgi:hypothetical protein